MGFVIALLVVGIVCIIRALRSTSDVTLLMGVTALCFTGAIIIAILDATNRIIAQLPG